MRTGAHAARLSCGWSQKRAMVTEKKRGGAHLRRLGRIVRREAHGHRVDAALPDRPCLARDAALPAGQRTLGQRDGTRYIRTRDGTVQTTVKQTACAHTPLHQVCSVGAGLGPRVEAVPAGPWGAGEEGEEGHRCARARHHRALQQSAHEEGASARTGAPCATPCAPA